MCLGLTLAELWCSKGAVSHCEACTLWLGLGWGCFLRPHELGTWMLTAVLKYPGALYEGQLLRLISAASLLLRNCRQSREAGGGALRGVPAIPFQPPLDCCDLLHALLHGHFLFCLLEGAPKLRESTQMAACSFAFALNWGWVTC